MEEIVRNVSELGSQERHAFEVVVGHPLDENQQITIRVQNLSSETKASAENGLRGSGLPEWCNVYEGLSDAEIAAIEEDILERADLTRPGY